jgi:hypothetical protein
MGSEDKYAQYPERPSDSRLRYFDGQFLGSQDFIDEQRYHVDRLRRHTRLLRIRGVADGLGVAAIAVLKVRVEAGTAIDDNGRQVVLLAARDFALPADLARPGQYLLSVAYGEHGDRTLGGSGDQKGTRGDTRFREEPVLAVSALAQPTPPAAVVLALLTIDGEGKVAVSTPAAHRVYSGLRLGPGGPTLSSGGDPRPQELIVGGDLRVQGALHLRDGVIQNGDTPVKGGGELGLYSQLAGKAVRLVSTGGSFALYHDGGLGTTKMHEFHPDGGVTLGAAKNPLRISSDSSGFADGSNHAEISNDTAQFKCLMLVGNGSGGAGRTVGVWDNLDVAGRARIVQGLSIKNPTATRAFQLGNEAAGIGMDSGDVNPNAGYIRFGDNTGWRLHFARASEKAGGAPNQGPAGALMTIHDSGQVGIGTPAPAPQTRLRVYEPSAPNQWVGRVANGGDNGVVVSGELNGRAVIGATNALLDGASELAINPGGRVVIGTAPAEPNATLTVDGTTVLRTGGTPGWDRLVVTTTNEWGDAGSQYVTLGAGGPAGIMLSNPHITWRDGKSSLRYGRTGGVPGGTYWDVGLRADGSFSAIPADGGGDGSERLKIERNGNVTLGGRGPLRFSHVWTGLPDVAGLGGAEICNDIDSNRLLMIVGNKSAGMERRIGMWDRVDINGTLSVNGFLNINQNGVIGLRVTNFTNRGVYMDICYEGANNTIRFYHQSGQGQFMGQDGVWARNSDRSLKHDVTPLHDALELALRLRPVRYTWNATGTACLGLIAQDVAPLFPELVTASTRGEGEQAQTLLGLKYDAFGVIAIAAVQQLKQQLEARIAALDAQLRELAGARPR